MWELLDDVMSDHVEQLCCLCVYQPSCWRVELVPSIGRGNTLSLPCCGQIHVLLLSSGVLEEPLLVSVHSCV